MGKTNTINEEYIRGEDLNQELIVLYTHKFSLHERGFIRLWSKYNKQEIGSNKDMWHNLWERKG